MQKLHVSSPLSAPNNHTDLELLQEAAFDQTEHNIVAFYMQRSLQCFELAAAANHIKSSSMKQHLSKLY